MRKVLLLFLIFVVTTGCLGPRIKAPPDKLNKIQKIAVVPMESPPLFYTPIGNPLDGLGVFHVFAIFVAPFAINDWAKSTIQTGKLADSKINAKGTWIPTVVFAQEAGKQITTQGKHEVVVIQGVQKYPDLVNRERTAWGGNWSKPINNWYNEKKSQFDYKSFKNQQIDAVLEVAIGSYGAMSNYISLGVMLKLVDPMSGQVLGRAQTLHQPQRKIYGIFEKNGQKFKDIICALGSKLITKNLKKIGLLYK